MQWVINIPAYQDAVNFQAAGTRTIRVPKPPMFWDAVHRIVAETGPFPALMQASRQSRDALTRGPANLRQAARGQSTGMSLVPIPMTGLFTTF
jgi:hypothetical protein